jgi:hypothetical protein
LSRLLEFTGATTPIEFTDRFEVLEQDAREQWYHDGHHAGYTSTEKQGT